VATSRLLVVDDDPKFLRFVTELLSGAGYDVRSAADPTGVVAMAEALAPDLVVLDISMPGKDGFEVARELQANPNTQAVGILFMTGHRDSTHVKRAKAVGGSAYLEKPFKSSTLIWMIKALLAGRRNAAEGPGVG